MTERAVFHWKRLVLLAAGWMAVAMPMLGQRAADGVKTPAYDVAAIRLNKSGGGMMRINTTGDGYSVTNVTLKNLIVNAYGLKMDTLLSGLPGWADSARIDIDAKMDGDTVAELQKLSSEERAAQRRLMLQSLLADRFQLKIHHESKELPMYSLVVAKGGFKLKAADPNYAYPNGVKGGMMFGRGQLTAQGIPISNLAANLSYQVHRIVEDKTGLTGKYDIQLRWSPDDSEGSAMPGGKRDIEAAAADTGPSIFTALEEQLGLKLESTKGPVDTIVVDHVEMPSEN